ncbi:MAG: hypothetical protein P9M11_09140 [Candidatus Tenebribacter burtonii]|nr:hypothetical protein [Candidatus Tenebribacter burtonii]
MKKIMILVLIMIALFGCGTNQKKVNNCISKAKNYVNQKEFKKAISILKIGIPMVTELEALDNSFGTSNATFDMQNLISSPHKDTAKKISYLLGYSYLMEKEGELAMKYSSIAFSCDETDSQALFIFGWSQANAGYDYEGKNTIILAAKMGNSSAKAFANKVGWYY